MDFMDTFIFNISSVIDLNTFNKVSVLVLLSELRCTCFVLFVLVLHFCF